VDPTGGVQSVARNDVKFPSAALMIHFLEAKEIVPGALRHLSPIVDGELITKVIPIGGVGYKE